MDGNSYYTELRNRYAAVRKQLYGLKGPTGVVPPSTMPEKPNHVQDPVQVVEVVPEAKSVLVRLENATPAMMHLIREIADKHGIDPNVITKPNRKVPAVLCRWEVYYRAKTELGMSYNKIARVFKTDHTTVMHGVKKFDQIQIT